MKHIPRNLVYAAIQALETGENLEIIERHNKTADLVNLFNKPYGNYTEK